MLNTNNLSYWTLQRFQYILTPISNMVFMGLDEEKTATVSTENHTFCYVKSGAISVTFESFERHEKSEKVTLDAGSLIEWSGKGLVELTGLEDNTKILILSFEILRPSQLDRDEMFNKIKNEGSMEMVKLTIAMPHILQLDFSSQERHLLESLCNEAAERSVGFVNKSQLLLSMLVFEIVKKNPLLPRYIDAVAVTSNMDNDIPMASGREVFVDDIEIWNDNPSVEGSYVIQIMRASNYFVSNEFVTSNKQINCELVKDGESHEICRLWVDGVPKVYKVVFWQDKGIKPFDITRIAKRWVYIKTRIKSNMTGNIGIGLYSAIGGHRCFGKSVYIEKPDVWQEITVPIMFVQYNRETSPIVSKAIRYIHDNYSQKITLKTVAEAIYTNPNYLSTVFSREKEMTFSAYIRSYRLSVAQKMLIETDLSVEKIAISVGFYDIQHFSKLFKKEYGVSPCDFRKSNKLLNK